MWLENTWTVGWWTKHVEDRAWRRELAQERAGFQTIWDGLKNRIIIHILVWTDYVHTYMWPCYLSIYLSMYHDVAGGWVAVGIVWEISSTLPAKMYQQASNWILWYPSL